MLGTGGKVAKVGTAGSDGAWLDWGTEGDGSVFDTFTSLAPVASSPQCGQNFTFFNMEAQSRWKRCEMLP